MILSFKKKFPWNEPTNFEEKILSGSKIHTIREDPHGRWMLGRKAHLANGVRTKNYNCFMEDDCTSIQMVDIVHSESCNRIFSAIIISAEVFYRVERNLVTGNKFVIIDNGMIELAKNDGFDSVEDFFKWFNTDFQGKIIHWTDFRY